MTSRYALQDTAFPRSHEFITYLLQLSTFNLSPKAYHLQPTTGRVGLVSGIIFQNRSEWTFKCFSIERSMNEDFHWWVGEK